MTPEKMRALQRQVDDLKAENENLAQSLEVVSGQLVTCERALKRRTADLKNARAKIKRLSAPAP